MGHAPGRGPRPGRRFGWALALAAGGMAGAGPGAAWAQGALIPLDLPQDNRALAPPGAAAPAARPGAGLGGLAARPAADRDAPVTFTAEEVEYDQERGVVTARGKVEAWQGERFLRADTFTYDRNTGVATARGNVQLLEPDGQVLFVDAAELGPEFRDGVLEGIRGLLAANGRLAANGARRTGGSITDLARVVYSSCNLCADDPTRPPLWQLRARTATLDSTEQRVRYRDAAVQLAGVPLLYTPYLSHPSPDAPRQSGVLSPSFGYTRFLGAFAETPYYWAIDDSSDLTVAPTFSTRQDPNLGVEYRRRFNRGEIQAAGSLGHLNGVDTQDERGFGGHIFSRGRFSIDENWRAGFDLNRASSELYLRTWRYGARRVLPSTAFAEGFWGTEGYARFDARAYQGLRATDDVAQIPFVLPNLYYERVLPTDRLGGRATMDAGAFAVFRDQGTSTRRLASRIGYELPGTDRRGMLWTVRAQADLLGYNYDKLDQAPNFFTSASGTGTEGSASDARANARLGLDWRWPLLRPAGAWGSQLVEPRVQLVTGPATGNQRRFPNEDSLDFEFTDANLFALNRFVGRDRQEGGTRADAALRGAWYFPNGGQVEGLVGRSVRVTDEFSFGNALAPGTVLAAGVVPSTGLENRLSDWVGRARVSPVPWFELLGRTRLAANGLDTRLTDLTATTAVGRASFSAGYLYATPSPYLTPIVRREEVSLGTNVALGQYWRASAYGRYDVDRQRPVRAGATVTYEDECLIFDVRLNRNFAEDPTNNNQLYPASTLLLLRVAFKTVGDFGFRAL